MKRFLPALAYLLAFFVVAGLFVGLMWVEMEVRR
jgi:hypothetical protein